MRWAIIEFEMLSGPDASDEGRQERAARSSDIEKGEQIEDSDACSHSAVLSFLR